MRTLYYIYIPSLIALIICTLSVSAVFAQANPQDAAQITDCSRAQQLSSVGQTSAQGSYVPVSEAAVMFNTSRSLFNTEILRYKECVLRPLVNAQRKAMNATIVRNGTVAFMTGRNGGPLFVQNLHKERLFLASDPEIIRMLKEGTFDRLDPAFRNQAKAAIAQGYFAATRKPNDPAQDMFVCHYQGDLQTVLNGSPDRPMREALQAMRNPMCNPVLATEFQYENAQAGTRLAVEALAKNVDWGQGIYPRIRLDADGNYVFTDDTEVTTPASIVRDLEEQLLGSGLRQNENANNVNEMVSTLFATVGTQIISNDQGFNSLLQPTSPSGAPAGSGPSFLDRVVSQSGGQLTQITANAALQILNAALAIERAYNQAENAIAAKLNQTIAQLRMVERQCWVSLAQNICAPGTLSADGKTCTDTAGTKLTNIATSTQFSQAVITNQITPLASSTLANIAKSDAAITTLGQFIATVSANPATQGTVLAQYNRLSAQGAFHTQSDVTAAQTQLQTVTTATNNLVQNTINTWAGTDSDGNSTIPWDNSISPGTGWCNFQNQQTRDAWDQRWR